MKHHIKATSYIRPMIAADERRRVLDAVCERIATEKLRFTAIAFTGVSGAVVGPALADRLNKNLIAVRKGHDKDNHSNFSVEGVRGAPLANRKLSQWDTMYWKGPRKRFKYVIVDDLIGSGSTIRRVRQQIAEEIPEAICAGVVLYTHAPYDEAEYARTHRVPRVIGVQL